MEPNLSWSVKNGALIPPTRWMQIEAIPDLEWNPNLRKLIERKYEPLTLRFIKKGEGLRWFQYGAMYMKPSMSLNKGTTPPPDRLIVSGSELSFRFISEREFNDMDELTKLKLFVHGFSLSISTKDLVDYFNQFTPGKVVHSQIAPSTLSSRPHFGYVLFKDRKSLTHVLGLQIEHNINGETIKIQEYDSRVRKGGGAKPLPSAPVLNTSQTQLITKQSIFSSGARVHQPVSELGFENQMKKTYLPSPSFESNSHENPKSSPHSAQRIRAFSSRSKTDEANTSKQNMLGESKSDTQLGHLSHLYYQKREWREESADSPRNMLEQLHSEQFVVEVLRVPSHIVTAKSKDHFKSSQHPNIVFNLLVSRQQLNAGSSKKP